MKTITIKKIAVIFTLVMGVFFVNDVVAQDLLVGPKDYSGCRYNTSQGQGIICLKCERGTTCRDGRNCPTCATIINIVGTDKGKDGAKYIITINETGEVIRAKNVWVDEDYVHEGQPAVKISWEPVE